MKASQQPRSEVVDEDEETINPIDLTDETQQTLLAPSKQENITDDFDSVAFESHFGLIQPEDLVIIRSYSGEEDEMTLQEIRPRFIVMYDPDPAFIRRVEVSLSA
jgi:DNA excision repair protein ERCC-4